MYIFSNKDSKQQIDVSLTDVKKTSWSEKYSNSTYADLWLMFFSFIEASFFPLPPSTFMISIMSSNDRHKKWLYYGTLTTVSSVFGGIFGYLIGSVFYDAIGQFIINAYDLSNDAEKVGILLQNNAFLATFIAAFTPIPYKVFTLTAGFFDINIFTFIVASLIGRGARFYIVAYLVKTLGDKVGDRAMKYLNYFAILVAVVVILYFFFKIFQFIF